jgi:C4-dicarboxylate-specific signal transduction histidine kinase
MDVDFRFYPPGTASDSAALRWVNSRGTVIEYQGAPALFVTMMDISRIMELEQLVRIQDKMASLGRVAAGIAHEIRNPLTGINSYVYMLQRFAEDHAGAPEEGATLREIIEALQAASNRIEAVIRRVMDFSKPGVPKLSPARINRAVEEAIQLAAVTLRKSGVAIETKLDPALPLCPADSSMIEQVLLNLLTNAAQAMTRWAGEKRIAVQTWQQENGIAVAVADSGPGIAPENRAKIFDPFFTTKSDGSGIGLSLCQRIIADHKGTLTVGTSRWGGAEFRIEIPLGQAPGKKFEELSKREA